MACRSQRAIHPAAYIKIFAQPADRFRPPKQSLVGGDRDGKKCPIPVNARHRVEKCGLDCSSRLKANTDGTAFVDTKAHSAAIRLTTSSGVNIRVIGCPTWDAAAAGFKPLSTAVV
jgi:hypothetical protein